MAGNYSYSQAQGRNFTPPQITNYHQPRQEFIDPLRNPYEQDISRFRAPFGVPPRIRYSPAGFSPRYGSPQQDFSSSTPLNTSYKKRPYTDHDVSPQFVSRGPGMSPFQGRPSHHQSFSPRNSSFSSRFSPYSPRNSPYSPRSTFQQNRHWPASESPSDGNCNITVRDYYSPSIMSDPWQGLRPVKAPPTAGKG